MNHTVKRIALSTLAAAALAMGLSACAPLMLGGAAVGTMVAIDRRTSGTQLEDETIELRAASRIREVLGTRTHVNVTSYNRQVLLTGEVPDEATRQTVDQIVTRVENVRSVVNELGIMPPSSLSQRSNDVLITGKMKASLIDARDLQSNAFKVVTERGTLYLLGRVTQREADRATQIARGVSGVNRVVRVFEIISDDELARISTEPARPAAAASAAK